MADDWSFEIRETHALLVHETDFKVLLQALEAEFTPLELSVKFADDFSFESQNISTFLNVVSDQDRKVVAINVLGYCRGNGDSRRQAGRIALILTDDSQTLYAKVTFDRRGSLELKDRLTQFISRSRPWWGSAGLRLCIEIGAAIAAYAICFKLFVNLVGGMQQFKELWFGNRGLLIALAIAMFWLPVASLVKRGARHLFPNFIFLIGGEARRYEKLREQRKWTVGFVVSALILFLLTLADIRIR